MLEFELNHVIGLQGINEKPNAEFLYLLISMEAESSNERPCVKLVHIQSLAPKENNEKI